MTARAEEADGGADGSSALASALAAHGLRCRVEPRGRLAVLVTADHAPLGDPATRRRVATLAMAHGFTHVALELDPPSDDREALRST